MKTKQKKQAAPVAAQTVFPELYPVFDTYMGQGDSVYTECAKRGLDTWTLARPTAIHWAAKRYKMKVIDGQRGLTLGGTAAQYNTANQAMKRLAIVFAGQGSKPKKSVDMVLRLVRAYNKLDGNDKRRFRNQAGL
jgi:hypothetical protein